MSTADRGSERALVASPRRTKTQQMLDWAIAHHESTGEAAFYVDRQYVRAAAQHYQGTWGVGAYWVTLKPPLLHERPHEYLVKVETYVEGELWGDDDD